MRLLALLFVTGSFALVGCSGDSSALMSVWNDSGAGGAGGKPMTGGVGGQGAVNGGSGGGVTIPLGGSGGSVVSGTIRVTGGTRDLASAQCLSTSGGACPVSGSYLTCLEGNCPTNLTDCYYSDGSPKPRGAAVSPTPIACSPARATPTDRAARMPAGRTTPSPFQIACPVSSLSEAA